MAYLDETALWHENIYQLATEDLVLGGAGGPANIQPKQLADRTQWLKAFLLELDAKIQDTSLIDILWKQVFGTDLDQDTFEVYFFDLDGITLESGVWNQAEARIEV
jgi:hypothetical protein